MPDIRSIALVFLRGLIRGTTVIQSLVQFEVLVLRNHLLNDRLMGGLVQVLPVAISSSIAFE